MAIPELGSHIKATVAHNEMRAGAANVDHLSATEKATEYVPGAEIAIDKATDRRLFWKIARRILVIQVVTYFCQSLDKGILNYASIMGIQADAHLKGQEASAASPLSLGMDKCLKRKTN